MAEISEQELNLKGLGGAKITRRPAPGLAEVSAPAPPAPPAPVDNSIPMASMAASMNAINAQLGDIVAHNSRVIEGLQDDMRRQMVKSPGRKPWRAKVIRDRNRLIDYVDLIPLEK